jgi:hypothetical protein
MTGSVHALLGESWAGLHAEDGRLIPETLLTASKFTVCRHLDDLSLWRLLRSDYAPLVRSSNYVDMGPKF